VEAMLAVWFISTRQNASTPTVLKTFQLLFNLNSNQFFIIKDFFFLCQIPLSVPLYYRQRACLLRVVIQNGLSEKQGGSSVHAISLCALSKLLRIRLTPTPALQLLGCTNIVCPRYTTYYTPLCLSIPSLPSIERR
jgi:hypothetical protein